METRVCIRTAIIATFIIISAVGASSDISAQNFSACGTLQQGLDCMFFYPFAGGTYLLDNYGGLQPGDTVIVTGFNDVFHGPCLCVTFQYQCVKLNTIVLSGPGCTAPSCCQGTTGNVNGVGLIDLGDLSMLVAYLTGGITQLPCFASADIDRSGVVDLRDLSEFVNHIIGGGYQFPACP